MEKVTISLEVPKEANEVKNFIVELIKDIKGKKEVTAIVAENLAGLMSAIDGFDKLSTESKEKEIYNLAAVLVADLIAVFTDKK